MKRIAFVFVLVLAAVGFVTPRLAGAHKWPLDEWYFRFVMEDEASKVCRVQRHQRRAQRATGVMTLGTKPESSSRTSTVPRRAPRRSRRIPHDCGH